LKEFFLNSNWLKTNCRSLRIDAEVTEPRGILD
jgi:hypothetical protein